jgi:DNA invertase Pin-like site-specific DNA recombinase
MGHIMIIGYARVSTKDQSLDRQRDELLAAGCDVVHEETASGKRGAHRPIWDETIRNLRSGDTLVVVELSRLGRSTAELAALADELQERGVALRILNLGAETNTVAGRLVFTVVAAVAQMERELLIERTKSGLEAARKRHKHLGGRKPKLTAAKLKAARALRDSGELTMGEIAEHYGVSRNTLYRSLNAADQASIEQAAS